MAEGKYCKYICTDLKKEIRLPGYVTGENSTKVKPGERRRINHVIWMDSEIIPGAFYSECIWLFPGQEIKNERIDNGGGSKSHAHPFSEVITFFGTNWDDPTDLGGEVELWLEGEKHVLTKSFLCYVPAGMSHCPLKINRIDRPMFHFTLGSGKMYEK